MLWIGMLAVLAIGQTPSEDIAPASPPHNYLQGAESRRSCDPDGAAGEIVVCGAQAGGEAQRLRSADGDRLYAAKPPRAEMAIAGGGMLSVHNEANAVGGFPSNRAMVTLSLPIR